MNKNYNSPGMKNKYAFTLLILVFALMLNFNSAQAQAPFTVSPSNTVSETAYTGSSTYADLTIYLTNNLNGPLVMEWQTVSNTLPTQWQLQLCDWTKCFSDVISGRVMDTLAQGGTGFMKLTVGPIETAGSGTCVFEVWEHGNTATKETLTFNIDALVGVEENVIAKNLVIYPNPVKDQLFLNTGEITLDQVTLFDLTGAEVARINEGLYGNGSIPTAKLAPGVYILEARSGDAVLTKKILKTE